MTASASSEHEPFVVDAWTLLKNTNMKMIPCLPPPTTSHPPSRKEVAVLRGSGEPDLKEGVQLIKEECDELLKSAWYPRAEIMEVKHRMSKAYGGLAKNFTADDFHGVGDANELKRQILSVDRTLPALDYLWGGGSGLGR